MQVKKVPEALLSHIYVIPAKQHCCPESYSLN